MYFQPKLQAGYLHFFPQIRQNRHNFLVAEHLYHMILSDFEKSLILVIMYKCNKHKI